MSLSLLDDTPMGRNAFDVMLMDVYIDGNNSGSVLQDFPLEDINLPSTNFDFLDNFQEPHFETPPTAPELFGQEAPVKNDAGNSSPIYITVKDTIETGKTEISEHQEVPDVYQIPKLVIMKPPLRTVVKKQSKKQKEEMALLEKLDKLSKAQIVVPMIGVNNLRPRLRKQNLNPSVKRAVDCTTPKKKHDISKVRKQLFPSDSPRKENDEPANKNKEMFVKIEAIDDIPEIHKKIIATRRSLRNNTSCNIQEIYFSCDTCRKIFKDKKLLLHHRKTHSKTSQ